MRTCTKSLTAALAAASLLAAAGCRDTTEPFQPTHRDPPPSGPYLRLTFSPADDRAPTWSANGDSVYFKTSSWEGNPLAPSTIVALATDGMGSASPVLRNVQEGVGRTNWIDAPARLDDRIAFLRIRPLLDVAPCVYHRRVCPRMSELPMVRLRQGEVHVRTIDATHGLPDDAVLPLVFEGHGEEPDSTAPFGIVTISDYHPFQYEFETSGRPFYRPSWNPDGMELVVSDGLRLLRWSIGAEAATPIPGTADGISPAWSPNGDWIAYTRHERLSSETFMCDYEFDVSTPGGAVTIINCLERRTVYETAPARIHLVRPDGSEQILLGQGQDPTWSPDGSAVYASATVDGVDRIVRMPLTGAEPTAIAGTEGGIEPALSPDGSRLAFARLDPFGGPATRDIWIVELQ